jgi:hypothetical protein
MANPYRIQLLNDLHNYFPELLYNHERFRSTTDILLYVIAMARISPQQDDPYEYYQRQYQARYVRPLYNDSYRHDEMPLRNAPQRHRYNPIQRPSYQAPYQSVSYPASPIYPPPSPESNDIVLEFRSFSSEPNSIRNIFSQLLGDNFSQHIADLLYDAPLQDVLVIPTEEQVRNNTTLRTLDEDSTENCAICQDPFLEDQEVRTITHCRHDFHRTCIDTWFQSNCHCPNCRHDIRD